MNEDLGTLTPDQRRARTALESLAAMPADPDFRERLKQKFVSGSIARGEAARARGGRSTRWFRRPVVRWIAVPVGLAAALLAVSLPNRAPAWRVTEISGEGVAIVDGRPIPLSHTEGLDRFIRPGVRVRIPQGATLELASARRLAVQLTPGTEVTVPAAPGRWFGRQVESEILRGTMRVITGSEFPGALLRVKTPEAVVEVSGTTVAVLCVPEGTCVCLLEGRARVGSRDGSLAELDQGYRRFVYNDERPPSSADIRPDERLELGAFRERQRQALGI